VRLGEGPRGFGQVEAAAGMLQGCCGDAARESCQGLGPAQKGSKTLKNMEHEHGTSTWNTGT
jgi:hypothetical protein